MFTQLTSALELGRTIRLICFCCLTACAVSADGDADLDLHAAAKHSVLHEIRRAAGFGPGPFGASMQDVSDTDPPIAKDDFETLGVAFLEFFKAFVCCAQRVPGCVCPSQDAPPNPAWLQELRNGNTKILGYRDVMLIGNIRNKVFGHPTEENIFWDNHFADLCLEYFVTVPWSTVPGVSDENCTKEPAYPDPPSSRHRFRYDKYDTFLMRVGHPGWRKKLLEVVNTELRNTGLDGLFADDVWTSMNPKKFHVDIDVSLLKQNVDDKGDDCVATIRPEFEVDPISAYDFLNRHPIDLRGIYKNGSYTEPNPDACSSDNDNDNDERPRIVCRVSKNDPICGNEIKRWVITYPTKDFTNDFPEEVRENWYRDMRGLLSYLRQGDDKRDGLNADTGKMLLINGPDRGALANCADGVMYEGFLMAEWETAPHRKLTAMLQEEWRQLVIADFGDYVRGEASWFDRCSGPSLSLTAPDAFKSDITRRVWVDGGLRFNNQNENGFPNYDGDKGKAAAVAAAQPYIDFVYGSYLLGAARSELGDQTVFEFTLEYNEVEVVEHGDEKTITTEKRKAITPDLNLPDLEFPQGDYHHSGRNVETRGEIQYGRWYCPEGSEGWCTPGISPSPWFPWIRPRPGRLDINCDVIACPNSDDLDLAVPVKYELTITGDKPEYYYLTASVTPTRLRGTDVNDIVFELCNEEQAIQYYENPRVESGPERVCTEVGVDGNANAATDGDPISISAVLEIPPQKTATTTTATLNIQVRSGVSGQVIVTDIKLTKGPPRSWEVYTREFSGGLVMVNPSFRTLNFSQSSSGCTLRPMIDYRTGADLTRGGDLEPHSARFFKGARPSDACALRVRPAPEPLTPPADLRPSMMEGAVIPQKLVTFEPKNGG